jgi:hypothetical protein
MTRIPSCHPVGEPSRRSCPNRDHKRPPRVGAHGPPPRRRPGSRHARPATGPSLGPVMLSAPVIATTTCADFRCARGPFRGLHLSASPATGHHGPASPRPPNAGAQTDLSCSVLGCAHVPLPLRRTVLPGCISKIFTRSMAFAQWGEARLRLGSAAERRDVHDAAGFASSYGPRARSTPKGAFVVALRRIGSLLAPATSYTAAWSLPWPDLHRLVEHSFQDAPPRASSATGADTRNARHGGPERRNDAGESGCAFSADAERS